MEDILRLRIGDLKEEASEMAKFLGVSLSDVTRMALREKLEREKHRLPNAAQVVTQEDAGREVASQS